MLLENLHLVTSWLHKLEEIIMKIHDAEPHERFRLWMSSAPVKDFPGIIIQLSLVVALDPPR